MFEILFRPGTRSDGFGNLPFFQLLGGLAHFLAGLFQILSLLCHIVAVLRFLHPLVELIEIGQVLTLFVAQSLELPLDFRFFLLLRRAKGILRFLQLLIEILLALGQFLEPAERLELFPLLGVLKALGFAFRFISIIPVPQIELIELTLSAFALLLLLGGFAPALAYLELVGE